MAIRRRPLRGLSRELSLYGEQAGLLVLRAISAAAAGLPHDPDVKDLEALRDVAVAAISEAVSALGPSAASAALAAWDEVTGDSASGSSAAVAERALADVRGLADRKARWAIGEVMEGRADAGWFARRCSEAAWRGVNEAHLSALGQAARGRPGVRWARVPSGSDTCPFCLMLASRGFVYSSPQAAGGHYHPHCDCRVVAGNDGRTHVDGYEPEGMRSRLDSCRATLGLGRMFDEDGQPLPELLAEVARRDPAWILAGRPALVDRLDGSRPDEFETATAAFLSGIGFRVTFRPEDPTYSSRQADMLIGEQIWEMKNPGGSNDLTVYNQVRKNLYSKRGEVDMQSSRLVISNVRNGMSMEDMVEGLRRVLEGEEGYALRDLDLMDEVALADVRGGAFRRFFI